MTTLETLSMRSTDDRTRGSHAVGWIRAQRWWAARLLALPVHILLFAAISFFLIRLVPGDPVLNITGGDATAAEAGQIRHQLGLDGGELDQFRAYLMRLLHGDLGQSFVTHHPVVSDIAERFPSTLELAVVAAVALAAFSVAVSTLVLLRPRNVFSRIVRGYAHTAGAVPDFVLGVAAIFVFYSTLHWVPAPTGLLDPGYDTPRAVTHFPLIDAVIAGHPDVITSEVFHLVLPVGVLVLAIAPLLIRQLVSALEEAIDAAPTRFRIASGAPRHTVLASVYRRALPPAVTLFGTIFGALLGGAVIVEQLFGLPGIGQYAVSAVGANDYPALQGVLLVAAGVSLFVYFVIDILNMLLDPRRKPGAEVEAPL